MIFALINIFNLSLSNYTVINTIDDFITWRLGTMQKKKKNYSECLIPSHNSMFRTKSTVSHSKQGCNTWVTWVKKMLQSTGWYKISFCLKKYDNQLQTKPEEYNTLPRKVYEGEKTLKIKDIHRTRIWCWLIVIVLLSSQILSRENLSLGFAAR